MPAQAQNGDQILDGIGETGMLARYIWNGDLNDWSRNNLHGSAVANAVAFVNDERFGKVLMLNGEKNAFISLPGGALSELESLSITGWIKIRTKQTGQVFFDFGKDERHRLLVAPVGLGNSRLGSKGEVQGAGAMGMQKAGSDQRDGLEVLLATDNLQSVSAPAIDTNQWVHLALVIDIPSKSITVFVNSVPVAETKNITINLEDIFGSQPAEECKLFIGRSLSANATAAVQPAQGVAAKEVPSQGVAQQQVPLQALLHDFRLYRIPLNNSQVSAVFNHARGNLNEGSVNTRKTKQDDNLPRFAPNQPQLYNAFLVEVDDVTVETSIGNLPRLPAYVNGRYRDNIKGPKVRVLWPEATDNSAVRKVGNYTITGRVPGTSFLPKAFVRIKAATASKAPVARLEPFPLGQVTLGDPAHTEKKGVGLQNDPAQKAGAQQKAGGQPSPFIENRDKFINTLAGTNPDAFLFMFRDAFGQPQPEGAKPLGVWDSRDTKLRGHATGHYLSAIAQAYAGSGYDTALQANFAQKMNYMVNTLYDLSQISGKATKTGGPSTADPSKVPTGPGKDGYDSDLSEAGIRHDYWNWGKGFISAYPPDQFIMLEQGAKYGGQKTQVWAPYYTLHKILAGLLDIYQVSGNQKALTIASDMTDWVYARLRLLPTDTLVKMWNTYIAGEFGGMNEAAARLYLITQQPNHLKTAILFDNIRVFFGDTQHSQGLAKNVDLFRGLHANQHIPQVVGSIETYRATQNPEYYQVAANFWYKAVNDYMYSIGGVAGARHPANAECFVGEPGTLYENGFSADGQNETCATYNMLKLTSDLFMFDQQAAYMDYYERALYNHILASVAENNPANTYHVPLRPGSIKQFGNPNMNGFTCCNGTAIESNTKLQNAIYFKSSNNQSLYVNLYIASTLNWKERNISITQSTQFPKEDQTRLTIHGNGQFDLHVRVPGWASHGFIVRINGKAQKLSAKPGSYLTLSRYWKDGDLVELKMPFSFRLEPVMDQQNIASLFYGPVLLAAQEAAPRNDWRKITLQARDISSSIKGDPKLLQFTIGDVVFKPFYETYGRHSVYLDVTLQ